MTANLQPKLTVKQRAELMNVSERLVYMADKVMRLRPDLEGEIMAGRMTVNRAYQIATGAKKPTSWDRLVTSWNNASREERALFLAHILPSTGGDA